MNETNETSNEENLSKGERKALRRKEKEEQKQAAINARQKKKTIKQSIAALVVVGLLFGVGYIFANSDDEVTLDITKECITHQSLAMHIHPQLNIVVNGEEQDIPADVGVASATCMRPIHTHDSSGTLHAEYGSARDFKLGEFFQVWDKPFSKEQILDYEVDEEHEIVVTVNGQVSEAYENLVMNDKDKIVIEYKAKE